MTDNRPISLSEHLRRAAKARWAKTPKKDRSAHARMMVVARETKRLASRKEAGQPDNAA